MRHIELNPDPECVTMLKKAQRKREEWKDLSTDPKRGPLLRQRKSDEQGGLCGYCECRLTEADGTLRRGRSQLDHVLPRHPFEDLIFEWDNLILSCPCKGHCDHHKGNEVGIIDPHKENPRKFITFAFDELRRPSKVSAVASSRLDEQEEKRANDTIRILNLNDVSLEKERCNRWWVVHDQIEELFDRVAGAESVTSLRAEARKLREEIEEGEFPSAMLSLSHELLSLLMGEEASD